MTEQPLRGSRRLTLLLRGVRARLAATYLAAAIVLAAAGVALFSIFFERGLLANVDDSLASRADATAADVVSSGFPDAPQRTPTVRRRPVAELNAITAIYSPTGTPGGGPADSTAGGAPEHAAAATPGYGAVDPNCQL